MVTTFKAVLLSDLHVANDKNGFFHVVAVIYPLEECPLPIFYARAAIWLASGKGFKGDKVRVQMDPDENGMFDLEIIALEPDRAITWRGAMEI